MSIAFSPVFNGQQFFDNNGNPLAGGKIYQYTANSNSVQATTYSDLLGVFPNPNPITLDSSGRLPAEIWINSSISYNFVVTDSLGTVLETVNNVTAPTGGGGGGVSFPLQKSTLADATNVDIAWVGADNVLGEYNNNRIRGIINDGTNTITDGSGNSYTVDMMFETNNSTSVLNNQMPAAGWALIMAFVEQAGYCGSSSAVYIPNLVTDNISGTTMVTSLSTDKNTLTVSSPSGYVSVGLNSPAQRIFNPINGITTTETTITFPTFNFGDPIYYNGPGGYRISVIGNFTSSAVGSAYFNLYYGTTSNPMSSNTAIAQWTVATSGTGITQFFKLDVDVYLTSPSSGSLYLPMAFGELTCPSATGIATSTKTYLPLGQPASVPTFTAGSTVWMGLTAHTNSSTNSMNILASHIEAII